MWAWILRALDQGRGTQYQVRSYMVDVAVPIGDTGLIWELCNQSLQMERRETTHFYYYIVSMGW